MADHAMAYVYGTIAVGFISLLSLMGALIVPFRKHAAFACLRILFISAAISIMSADALLHLIPHSLALGKHEEENVHEEHNESEHDEHHEDHDDHADHGDDFAYLYKMLLIQLVIYILYFLESVSHLISGIRRRKKIHSSGSTLSDFARADDGTTKVESANATEAEQSANDKVCGVKPVALMVLLGGGIHNFADGLAIGTEIALGARFQSNSEFRWLDGVVWGDNKTTRFVITLGLGAAFVGGGTKGLSISIAIACHELPHEFGDFLVLIQSGLSIKLALILNLVSALTAFAGLYVGIALSSVTDLNEWIFAITAGMFFYISLVDMLPELHRVVQDGNVVHFACKHTGFVLGGVIITALAVFEHSMSM